MRAIGLDIGGTSVKVAMIGDSVPVCGQSSSYSRPDADELLSAVASAASTLPRGQAVDRIGLCVPGVVAADRRSVAIAVNVPGLVDLPFVDLVRAMQIGMAHEPHVITNDAHAAAFDAWGGMCRGRLLALAIGTGLGACVLDDGKRLLLNADSPGHLGQIEVGPIPGDPHDPVDYRIETYVGVTGLRARYGDPLETALAEMTVTDAPMQALIRFMRTAHAIFTPDRIGLIGGIGIGISHLRDDLHRAVSDELTPVANADWSLLVGESGFHGALGAARLALAPEPS